MNIVPYIVDFLKKNQSVEIPGFGVFFMKDTQAKLDEFNKSILPPSKEIKFIANETAVGTALVEFISRKENTTTTEVAREIQLHVSDWQNHISRKKEISIEGLGNFSFVDDVLHFTEKRTETITPDYYGLEEIDLKNLKKIPTEIPSEASGYKLNTVLFCVLALIPIAILSYLGVTQQELIFGKKSFKEKSGLQIIKKKKPRHIITIDDTLKVDTLKQNITQ